MRFLLHHRLSFLAILLIATVGTFTVIGATPQAPGQGQGITWQELPVVSMDGGLKIFWSVGDWSRGENQTQASKHGFLPMTVLNSYADYRGKQAENIITFVGHDSNNPWDKPPFFERIVRHNIAQRGSSGIFVNDIEFRFEEDAEEAWADPVVRRMSGKSDFATFEEAYFREWASWFWLLRIPTKPAMHSELMPATYSNFIPATVPI